MSQIQKQCAKPETQANIINYLLHQKSNGRAESTLESISEILKRLSRITDLDNPEQFKTTLSNLKWKNNTKNNAALIYKGYAKFINATYTPPKYTEENGLPFIPTEQELDTLITAGSPKTATLLQTLKETAARIGELEKLKWIHIDLQRRTIYITAEKGSNSRILPISEKLVAMLNQIPHDTENVFQTNKHAMRITFEALRNRTAKKLNNPRLKAIHMHTFRHFKGTMEYHKTKDIMHVKTFLGHKNIESTMLYIHLEAAIFLQDTDEWTCKIATTPEEAAKLIETGFTHADTIDGKHLYRKRK